MSRLSVLMVLVVGLLVGGVGVLVARPDLSEAKVRQIAESIVSDAPKPAAPLTSDDVRGIAESVVAELPKVDAPLSADDVRDIAKQVVAEMPAPAPSLDKSAVEMIVADFIARQPKQNTPDATEVAKLDPGKLNPMIESYLLDNPSILQRVSDKLADEVAMKRKEETRTQLAALKADIYDGPGHIVLGNPNGDVTLVEMFDYNCGYCRQALPDLATLLDEDPNLRVILKEFPILSQGSVEAARIAVQVSEANVDYWTFHQTLFTSPGKVDKDVALKAATTLGLNPITLEMGMNTPDVSGVIEQSYKIADQLKITGTPTYIIGDEIIPGAVGIDQLRARIANMRACGSTTCPAQPG
jgi:protein-disulfide isomerase